MKGYVAKMTFRDTNPEVQHTTELFIEESSFGKFMSFVVGRNIRAELFSMEAQRADIKPGEYTLPIVDESTFGYYVSVVPKEYAEWRFAPENEHETLVKKWEVDNEVETMSDELCNKIYADYITAPMWKKRDAEIIIEEATV